MKIGFFSPAPAPAPPVVPTGTACPAVTPARTADVAQTLVSAASRLVSTQGARQYPPAPRHPTPPPPPSPPADPLRAPAATQADSHPGSPPLPARSNPRPQA